MKKMLVSDYDQTFYINDLDIEKNKEAVNRFIEQGNIFTIATGRSYYDFKNKLNIYNFNYDYVILNHGATILDKNDNIIYHCKINDYIILDIKEHLKLESAISNFCCSLLDSRVEFEHGNITKIHAKYSTKEEAMQINEIINNKFSSYVNSYYVSGNAVEIISNEIDKSKAINLLITKLNIDTENIYTIGDGYSDIKMIQDYNGYCMDNSVEELKEMTKSYSSVSLLIEDIINQNI